MRETPTPCDDDNITWAYVFNYHPKWVVPNAMITNQNKSFYNNDNNYVFDTELGFTSMKYFTHNFNFWTLQNWRHFNGVLKNKSSSFVNTIIMVFE